ncbi:DUF2333 family protein [Patescibacteria group bacterium]|nr:DUF2333 family protein [Patescibacteria group bacterium]
MAEFDYSDNSKEKRASDLAPSSINNKDGTDDEKNFALVPQKSEPTESTAMQTIKKSGLAILTGTPNFLLQSWRFTLALPKNTRWLFRELPLHLRRQKIRYQVTSILALGIVFLIVFYGAYISQIPRRPPVAQKTSVPGEAFIQTIINLQQGELNRTWIPSNLLFRWWMDNLPEFQLGQRQVWKVVLFSLHEDVARHRTTGDKDPFVERALGLTSIPEDIFFIYPYYLSESNESLRQYIASRQKNQSVFELREDNLGSLLHVLHSQMGHIQTKMSQESTGKKYTPNAEGAGDSVDAGNKMVRTNVGNFTADNVFYRAKGTAFAVYAILKVASVEFEEVITRRSLVDLMKIALNNLELVLDNDHMFIMNSMGYDDIGKMSGPFFQADQKIREMSMLLNPRLK